MIINASDPNLLGHLSVIIDAFEEAALLSQTREGAMVVANTPLTAMQSIINSSQKVLATNNPVRTAANKTEATSAGSDSEVSAATSESDVAAANTQRQNLIDVGIDEDLLELIGGNAGGDVSAWLQECLGCDLRVQFGWQVKPLNMLGPIEDIKNQISIILEQYKSHMDPFSSLEGLCLLLNRLKSICPPDWAIMLVSMNLLLRKYMSNAFNLKLDWTVLVGPLVKVIVDGINSLLDGVMQVVLAPLDCAIGSLQTAKSLETTFNDLVNTAETLVTGAAGAVTGTNFNRGQILGTDSDLIVADVSWNNDENNPQTKYTGVPGLGEANRVDRVHRRGEVALGANRPGEGVLPGASFSFPAAIRTHIDRGNLEAALNDPAWFELDITDQTIAMVRAAKRYVQALTSGIQSSLGSLSQLVGGGIQLQMGNLGIILAILDMRDLIMMIVRMLREFPDVNDWCSFLEDNPEILQDALSERFAGPGRTRSQLRVENGDNNTLILREGPKIVAEITTCASKRSMEQNDLLNQWIKDLGREAS